MSEEDDDLEDFEEEWVEVDEDDLPQEDQLNSGERARRNLLWEANKILKENGSAVLARTEYFRHCAKQIFETRQTRRVGTKKDLKNVYNPNNSTAFTKAKTSGKGCANCGQPLSKYGGVVCRKCYQEKAKSNYEKKIEERIERIKLANDKYSYFLEYLNMDLFLSARDFSEGWIEVISEIEQQLKIPFVFWEKDQQIFKEH